MNLGTILGVIAIISVICYCIAKYCHFDEMHQPTWKNILFKYSLYILLGSVTCCVVYCWYYVYIAITDFL